MWNLKKVWDGWMASSTRWTWVWLNSGSWWWTGRPGVRRFMGSQRVGHDWATELNWTDDYNQFCLKVTVFQPWPANCPTKQYILRMEMFLLSYVNVSCLQVCFPSRGIQYISPRDILLRKGFPLCRYGCCRTLSALRCFFYLWSTAC